MSRTASLGWCPHLALLLLLACPAADAGSYQLPPVPKFDTVAQLDESLVGLRRISWWVYSSPSTGPDVRGQRIAQDVNRWLLTPQHETRLKVLRERAQSQAANPVALRATLDEAAERAHQESCLAALLAAYWYYQDLLALHAVRLQSLQEQLPHADGEARQRHLTPLLGQWADSLTGAMATDTLAALKAASERLTAATQLVFDAYNRERSELAVALSKQQRTQGLAPREQTSDAACPHPEIQTSGGDTPQLARDNRAPEEVYPPTSRHAWFEGSIIIDASIAANGCPQKATLYESSGVDELDDAALRWALEAHYLPAQRDAKAVDAVLRFRMRFKLSEAPQFQLQPR